MLRSASRKKIVASASALLLVGCDACGPDPPSPPEVESVVVRPSTILATPKSEFTLEAVAKGKFGARLSVASTPGLSIDWSDPAGVLADKTTNPVTVTVPDDPGSSFELVATVSSSDAPSVTSNSATVHVTLEKGSAAAVELDASGDISDWADVEHPTKSPPGALLIQAGEAGSPVRDWAVGVVGHVRLGHNFESAPLAEDESPPLTDELSEAAVWARERYMSLRPPPSGPQLWTPSADNVPANPMDYGGLRYLSVRVGVEDPEGTVSGVPVEVWAEARVDAALRVLTRNRAGVELDFAGVFKHGLFEDGDPVPAYPKNDCKMPDVVTTGDWDVNEYVLYVVYAPDVLLMEEGWEVPEHRTGWTCSTADLPDGDNRLVFLSLAETFPATLVHELGHVLALSAGNGAGAAGHVDGVVGFDMGNVMWGVSPMIYGGTRGHLTLGQLYRMNAHVDSWLNIVSPEELRLARTCTSTAWGACPALSADLGS